MSGEQIADRLQSLRERLSRCGGDQVKIVAVTKGFGPEAVTAAAKAGLIDVGENYAQELLAKARDLSSRPEAAVAPRWHFIGRLQRNKIGRVAGLVHLWHSVDRPELVAEIARRSPGARVLVQVDVAGIGGRGGCPPEETEVLVQGCGAAGLDVAGLMAVGPPGPPEHARRGFRLLAAQADELGLAELSMGMTADMEVAVE
ncbi:MAG: YggS family pyridoxal phosphate enzyme, partial [bacterium]|nr:YggS family pyridoxal phosphate enzyme [bacterium]